ncbi:MAG TPA: site-specific integrase [Candidatus Udaeobacter sp.]|nr:site-specific integrase [Candidatus Udaeobacter sp.]
MASIHKQAGKPNWFCAFRIWNKETGKWKPVFRSTKTSDKKQARKICDAWESAAQEAHNGKLSADAARDIIARGVSDVYRAGNLETLESATIKSWCEKWLQTKSIEASEGTHVRYRGLIERFIAWLREAKAKRDVSMLQASEIGAFRDYEAKARSTASANMGVKVLRICFGEAVRQGLLAVSPAARVKLIKLSKESKRRDFTLAEIKRILRACADNQEWRGLVLFGLYLGQRLGDLAKLTWRAVNLGTGEIAFTARKTGRRIILPLVQPLSDYLASLPASDNPDAYIFPNAAKQKFVASLSNQFREILVEAGLVAPRKHVKSGAGHTRARAVSEISFHSLRHSAVTMLKASGLSDVFAREIVGHETAAISRHYTHLSTDDLRNAMQRLPDVTEETDK